MQQSVEVFPGFGPMLGFAMHEPLRELSPVRGPALARLNGMLWSTMAPPADLHLTGASARVWEATPSLVCSQSIRPTSNIELLLFCT